MASNMSPMPGVKLAMDFYGALKEVSSGKKITKEEWGTDSIYGIMDNGTLKLHKEDGKLVNWILSDGDFVGTDWKVLD